VSLANSSPLNNNLVLMKAFLSSRLAWGDYWVVILLMRSIVSCRKPIDE
jgi:hypothetical protein